MSDLEVTSIIAILIAATGLFFTAYQVRTSTQQRRFQQISDIVTSLFDNNDICRVYYLIEYDKFSYPEDFQDCDNERHVDQLLRYLELAANLYLSGQVKANQFRLIQYEFMSVYRNQQIKKYLKFLDDLFLARKVSNSAFPAFRKVGEQLSRAGSKE